MPFSLILLGFNAILGQAPAKTEPDTVPASVQPAIAPASKPASPPSTTAPASPPVVTPISPAIVAPPADPRKLMLNNLLKAGILMLEGKAYRQFIQAFVDDEDRRRFEQAVGKNGYVDYNAWGKEKGEHMLAVLRRISLQDPVMAANRACFRADDIPKGKFSFVFTKGSWFIENKSQCPASAVEGRPAEKRQP